MYIFTFEELSLLHIYYADNRNALHGNLLSALPDIYDADMIAVFKTAVEKLDTLSDDEFAKIIPYISEDCNHWREIDIDN